MAAQTIQEAWRVAIARKTEQREAAIKIQNNAIKIQRLCRGYLVRRHQTRQHRHMSPVKRRDIIASSRLQLVFEFAHRALSALISTTVFIIFVHARYYVIRFKFESPGCT